MSSEDAPSAIDLVAEPRRAIVDALKKAGHATIPRLAAALAISTEAVRQQLSPMLREGWISSDCAAGDEQIAVRGRPATEYCLTPAAEELFPKRYGELSAQFFDLVDADAALTSITDVTVERLAHDVEGESLAERVERLRSIYSEGDRFTTVEKSDDGFLLVERNCPYLQFATERPLFCSSTVSALRRLTEREVVREQRFQDGDGRCVFHIYEHVARSASPRFEREPPRDAVQTRSRTDQ